ncbi:MAG TPA: hypothetical protein VF525_13080 [Pyrinomonadaceae bacterium]|jgi:hypothetical protein
MNEAEYEWQSWILSQLGELFSEVQTVVDPPKRVAVSKSISGCVNKIAGGNYREMTRILGTTTGRVRLWAQGENLPELGALLRFCYGTRETLVDVLMGRVTYELNSAPAQPEQNMSIKKGVPRSWSRLDLKATRESLEASINFEFPPPSLKDFSMRLNRDSNTLRYQFPQLCSLIVKRFRAYTKKSKRAFYRKIERALRAALKSTRPSPNLEKLVREFGCHRSVFISKFPDLYEALRKRNEEDQKNELADIESLLLYAATTELPPCSFKAFCQRSGRSDQSLRDSFPALCLLISERHALYRKEQSVQRREELIQRVKDIAYMLAAEGIHPSVRNIQAHFGTLTIRSSKVALTAIREVRGDLGINKRN